MANSTKERSAEQFVAELLEDPDVRREYEQLGPAYELAEQMIVLRQDSGLSQSEVADLAGVSTKEVDELENALLDDLSLDAAFRMVRVLNGKLSISMAFPIVGNTPTGG